MWVKETLLCPILCCCCGDTCLLRHKQPSGDLGLPGVLNVLWQSLNVSMRSPNQPSLLWLEKRRKHPPNLLDKIQLRCLTGLAGTWPSLWLFSLFPPIFFPPFLLHLPCVTVLPQPDHPLGCCQGANSSVRCNACIYCLFIPSIFSCSFF